ncbi:MAG TPA: Uma2 family endonuclease [Chthonomonadaceae bacterium]|nr:Uma2 family endonuclease [Chthonomonadaceae bacterium]
MAQAIRTPRTYTAAEYLLIERGADYKSELIDGQMWAMAGATEKHILISRNLSTIAHVQLRGSGCLSFSSDMKVLVQPDGTFAYPDMAIVCGERQYHDEQKDVVLNPVVLSEVLSPSAEQFDRGDKFLRYQQIPTFKEYVLVSQNMPRVDHFVRQESGLWAASVALGLEASVTLSAVALTLSLSEVYESVA